jgi:hypothetical protein
MNLKKHQRTQKNCNRKIFKLFSYLILIFISSCSQQFRQGKNSINPSEQNTLSQLQERSIPAAQACSKIFQRILYTFLRSLKNVSLPYTKTSQSIPDIKIILTKDMLPYAESFESGEIVISKGLIELFHTEGELAFVIYHEISHILLQHHGISNEKFDVKKIEREADESALDILTVCGYPSGSAIKALIAIQHTNYLIKKYVIENENEYVYPEINERINNIKMRTGDMYRGTQSSSSLYFGERELRKCHNQLLMAK